MDAEDKEKLLLVLDLDETLIHATINQLDRLHDYKIGEYFLYKRPFVDEFLAYAFSKFLVGIWSSASDDYVEEVVDFLIEKKSSLEFIWGRSRCQYKRNLAIDELGYYSDDIRDHYHYIKPLKKLKRKGFSLDRMLIVDDSPHKCQDNYGNAIYVKAFEGDQSDNELQKLLLYLDQIKNKRNPRRIEKRFWRNSI